MTYDMIKGMTLLDQLEYSENLRKQGIFGVSAEEFCEELERVIDEETAVRHAAEAV